MSVLEQLQIKPTPSSKIIQIGFGFNIIDETIKGYNRHELVQRIQSNQRLKIPEIPDTPLKKKKKAKKAKKVSPEEPLEHKEERPEEEEEEEEEESAEESEESSDDEDLIKRLPKIKPVYNIKPSPYYMNNREKFIDSINTFFNKFRDDIDKEAANITCENRGGTFSLLTHQKIINEYLNLYSPYRGILIFHGLGSGKTCSSISVAEGFKSSKQIIIMTPASLQMNYRSELKKCGDALYKYNQFWEFIPISTDHDRKKVSKLLSIPIDKMKKLTLKKQEGVMFVNIKKKIPNYKTLSDEKKELLDKQLDIMIETKYTFLNYNGMRLSHLKKISKGNKNPFDNKVIVIDEIHNFVSRITNKLTQPESLSMKLYELLMSAQNARLIFLTGTPMINYPNELGILFNMLRGYITTFTLRLSTKIKKKKIEQIIRTLTPSDMVTYTNRTSKLTITRNPYGFMNVFDKKYKGVTLDERGNIDENEYLGLIKETLKDSTINIMGTIEKTNHKALPDDLKTFKSYFIEKNTGNMKNKEFFKRRILGLNSYFRSAQETLMPAYSKAKDFHVVKIPMSDYQLAVYEEIRKKERKTEKKQARKMKNITSNLYKSSTSTYRLFSRAFCNFVFPKEIKRPTPAIKKKETDERLDQTREDEEEIVGEYQEQLEIALDLLNNQKETFLTRKSLEIYSPKFLNVIENLDPSYLHLVYSQFRTVEGIGVLKMALEANGYEEFKISKNDKKEWYIIPHDYSKPAYTLYTGTEETDEKEIVRNIFNNTWDKVPETIIGQLKKDGQILENKHGELIKCFMITSSGAEGISLHNVRSVHILEPYWHPVRIEQVIGRAKRICSHEKLPESERKIAVYLYLMTFSEKQLKENVSIELKLKDVSKLNNKKPLTSDETLFEISNIKEKISSQLLTSIKETAIDCEIYNKKGESIQCMSFGKVKSDKQSYVISYKKQEKDSTLNKKKEVLKVMYIEIKGAPYAYNKKTGDVYDFKNFTRDGSKLTYTGNPIIVGKLTGSKGSLKFKKI